MEYVKLLLLGMSLITVLMMSQVSARHHGRRHGQQSHETFVEDAGPRARRGNGHGHGHGHGRGRGHGSREFQGNDNGDFPIPGLPMKGPVSVPFDYTQQQPRGPLPPPQAIFPGSSNIYPQQPPNYGQQNPLITNNYPTYNQPVNPNNPFLPQLNTQGQGNIASRNNQFEDIQSLPSIEPVTNELPANTKPSLSMAKPTINPREFDLLYGSNLYEETKANQQNPQPDSKIAEVEPNSFDDRILLDTAARCKEGYKLVGTVCRLKV